LAEFSDRIFFASKQILSDVLGSCTRREGWKFREWSGGDWSNLFKMGMGSRNRAVVELATSNSMDIAVVKRDASHETLLVTCSDRRRSRRKQ
jgi:hypothetical protein